MADRIRTMPSSRIRTTPEPASFRFCACNEPYGEPGRIGSGPSPANPFDAQNTADQFAGVSPTDRSADTMVLCSSIVMVIGPTPPGTGEMSEAFLLTPSKSTSPTR